MNDSLHQLMQEATRLTLGGRLNEATQAIQRALAGTAGTDAPPRPAPEDAVARAARTTGAGAATGPAMVLDGCVFELDPPSSAAGTPNDPAANPAADAGPGEFSSGTYTHASRTCRYKLYAPPGSAVPSGLERPLVVMLHGCTQDPEDFAAGTGMNERAREQGFFVLYPAQAQDANPQRCWNWFKHNHQQRGGGEPALIASLTQAVMKQCGIDPRRVYIAGLSAGGAMAAIVAAAYPDIFAAVGVHSGLPTGAASDVAEAMAVMRSGAARPGRPGRAGRRAGTASVAGARPPRHVPTIVFHGDQDQTVHPRNGEQVIAAALGSAAAAAGPLQAMPAGSPRVERGMSAQGRRYTRSTHHGDKGRTVAEHWLVHGAGHAWSGGQGQGSYTDADGPDATREMLRFFFEHPHDRA